MYSQQDILELMNNETHNTNRRYFSVETKNYFLELEEVEEKEVN